MRTSLPCWSRLAGRNLRLGVLWGLASVALFGAVASPSGGSELAAAGPSPAGDPAGSPDAGLRAGQQVESEVVGERTARSRTYRLKGGKRLTKLFASPVNYQDGQGEWRPIDTSLEARPGGDFEVAAAGYDLSLPDSADGPVRVAQGDAWVEFSMRGANAAASVSGSSVAYSGVLPGVDLRYRAEGGGLKESLVLASPAAAGPFVFDLQVAPGLTPKLRRAGSLGFVDRAGETKLSVPAPFMRDAAGAESRAVSYELDPTADGWTLTVTPDAAWLSAAARRFPVEVDPSVYPAAATDCTLDAATPTTSLCGDGQLKVGWDGSQDRRALLKFDVNSVVPAGAQVEYGYLALYEQSKTTSNGKDLGVYRMTRDWSSSASWNRYDGTNSWTAAGGDFDSTLWRKNAYGTHPSGTWDFWSIGALIQGWRDGTYPNYGLVLKDVSDHTTNNVLSFGSSENSNTSQRPYMGITWDYRLGEQRQFTLDRQSLSDRSQLSVNVANGNLIYRGDDMRTSGVGLDLNVSRSYNSLTEDWEPLISGRKWNLSAGGGIFAWVDPDGDVNLFGASGDRYVFHKKSDGSYTSPTALDATLTTEGSGWKLKFDKTEQVWHFNSNGDLARQDDRNGNEISYSYSAPTVLNQITDTEGRTVTTSYYTSGNLHTLQDLSGRVWSWVYDNYNRPTSYTDPNNKTTSYTYTGPDLLATITDPRGKVTKLEYDSSSRITAIKRNYVSATNSWTAKTSYAYSSPTSPCSSTTDVGKTVATDPRGHDTTYCYDTENRVTKVVDPNGNTSSATYTANSDVATSTLPGPATTTNTYSSNNLTQVDQPAGEQTKLEYTSSSHPRSITKLTTPQGTITDYAYDTAGNMTTSTSGTSPTQVQAKLEYNGQGAGSCSDDSSAHSGSPRCAIDGNGNITSYGYDVNGNLDTITPPSPLGDTTMTYDSLSRIRTVEDGKGQTRTYTYDAIDRIRQIAYSNGDTIAYSYDENGNLTQRDDSVAGTSTYTYDALNRRTQDSLTSGTTSYGWDAGSNLTSLTDPGGTVSYRYDNANRLQDMAEPGGSCTGTVSLCTTFGYNSRDQRTSTAYPNGVTQTVSYDNSDKPTEIKAVKAGSPATTLTDFVYAYGLSPSGQSELIQSVIDKDNNKTSYGYDFLGRLTSAVEKANGGSGTTLDDRAWTYDQNSNRKTQTANGTTASYAYNPANELCWLYTGSSSNTCASPPSGATTYTYDANGNTTASSAGASFSYNVKDQTTSWTPAGGSATSFAYAGPDQNERRSIAGTTEHNTLVGLTREGSTEWTRDPDGTLISQNISSTRHYYLTDQLGSTVGLTDSSGTLANTYKYDPFGLARSSSGSVSNPFQYVDAYRSPTGNDGLYKMGARYYQPGLGRWTQPDTVDQPLNLGEGNRFAYVAADPINHIDPTGQSLLGKVFGAAKGCLEGVTGKIGPQGPVIIKAGKKFIKVIPGPSKVADCAGGAVLGLL